MPRLRAPPLEADYYEILGVSSKATQQEIRRSFRRLVLEAHPDKNPHRVEWSERRIRELIQAFEVLGNAETRSEFDRRRRVKPSARKKERPFFFYRSDPMARARLILHQHAIGGAGGAARATRTVLDHGYLQRGKLANPGIGDPRRELPVDHTLRQMPEEVDDLGMCRLVAGCHKLVQEPLDARAHAL